MAYPDNSFGLDVAEVDQYGGANPATLDNGAWAFITGLVRSISKVVLSHIRVSYTCEVVVTQESMIAGDLAAIDLTTDALDPTSGLSIPFVGKLSTISATGHAFIALGICVAPCSALKKLQYAVGGLIPPSISGLSSQAGGALVSANTSTNKLKPWVTGDDALGYTSPAGNVLLNFPGRVT